MAKTPVITLRVDEARRDRWDKAAKRAGLSLSDFLRDAGDAAAAAPRTTNPTPNPAVKGKGRRVRTGMCPHRRVPEQFCSRCDA